VIRPARLIGVVPQAMNETPQGMSQVPNLGSFESVRREQRSRWTALPPPGAAINSDGKGAERTCSRVKFFAPAAETRRKVARRKRFILLSHLQPGSQEIR